MNNNFDRQLNNYAKLITNLGANIQPNQLVIISAEVYHRDLCYLIAKQAYELGAKYVNLELSEPRLSRDRIINSNDDNLQYVSDYLEPKYRELLKENAALIRIIGPEYPEIISDLDPRKINLSRVAQYKKMQFFYEDGISKSQIQWMIAAAPTKEWAQRIFPHLTPELAENALWQEIFKICRVDTDDFIERWADLNHRLQVRADKLSSMKIKSLNFVGPETDLKVGLSQKALWRGGSERCVNGNDFQPNVPTEECFTTPNNQATEGHFKATRPFLINGKLISGLRGVFKAGHLVEFSAEQGEATFREYINSDEGAKRLGEVALVGTDSPIFQSGLVFEEILFDENAACHIAIGSAYRFCLEGGTEMNTEQLAEIGCNESTVHTDMMISDENVDVIAELWSGEKVMIIEKGQFKI